LEPKVVFFCDFATNIPASPKSLSSWKALQDPSLDTGNLIRLLKSQDPKIRSLAIFALDHKNDPSVLPRNCGVAVGPRAIVLLSNTGSPASSARQTGDLASGT
jgi:hypothetical protein